MMTRDEALNTLLACEHAFARDQWTRYIVEPEGLSGYVVKRIRFCMVEVVAR